MVKGKGGCRDGRRQRASGDGPACALAWPRRAAGRLIELLVAMAIFTFVMGAALSLFEVTVKSAPKDQERPPPIREAQTGLSGMIREVRNAYDIVELTPNVIDFLVTRQGVQKRVRYECGVTDTDVTPALKKCERSEGTVASRPGPAARHGQRRATVIGRMLNGGRRRPRVQLHDAAAGPAATAEDDPLDCPRGRRATIPAVGLVAGCPPAPWPTSIGVKVKVPAKGERSTVHDERAYTALLPLSVSWSDDVYLRNLEAKQSPYNSGG